MHVIFIHGTGGNGQETFFLWAQDRLRKLGCKVSAPDLPSAEVPNREAWMEAILELYDSKRPTIFVGRSLGGTLIPYLLEQDGVRGKAAISIAAPITDLGWDNLKDFFSVSPDCSQARKSVEHYYHWYSSDDPYVPVEHGLMWQDKLGGKFRLFEGYSHFYDEEFPELVELVKNIIDLTK